jgi:hypothetical protein
MSTPLEFELVLDPAETVRAGQEVERRARTLRSQAVWFFWLLIPLVMALTLHAPLAVLKTYFIVMVLVGLFALVWPAIRERQVARLYAATPALSGPQSYTFTDDGLAIANAGVSNLVRWSAFTEAAETPEFFLLYYSRKCAYYLPKRIIHSDDVVDTVRAFLREKLGERAAHIAPPT